MLASTFRITEVFVLRLRNWIVVFGNIMSGELSDGMWMESSENNACFKIHSIEAVNSIEDHALIGLTFDYKGEYQFDLLKKLEGTTVLITNKIDVT